ncbi:MAG: DUF2071 domain-containing protein [Parachlamydiales bacterium]|jgi:hypothetical protein
MALEPFLSAKWKYLAMINYEIDPSILTPFIPQGTQIDLLNGKAYVSLVGFMFLDTFIRGFPIPFHRDFEEVNLRFYVKKNDDGRRGVVFIKEIVPRWGIAYIARRFYNEKYVALPMKHLINKQTTHISVEYQWEFKGKWQKIALQCQGEPHPLISGSEEEFMSEHYWGYSVQRDGGTLEYQVEHLPWRIWNAELCDVAVDMESLYGPVFAPFLEEKPASSFLAEGSDVLVYKGERVTVG